MHSFAGFLLIALFAAGATLAIASIVHSLHRYGPAALRLGKRLRECPECKVVRWKVTTIEVRAAGAQVLRPDFRPGATVPARLPALRAAA